MNDMNFNEWKIPPPSILFVDDEESILPEYQEFFSFRGLNSMTTSDPELAIDIVLKQPNINFVITDLWMSPLDGVELIKKLRKTLPAHRSVNFIILTGDLFMQLDEEIADVPVFMKLDDLDALFRAINCTLPVLQ